MRTTNLAKKAQIPPERLARRLAMQSQFPYFKVIIIIIIIYLSSMSILCMFRSVR